jgi:hypothetical protein
MGLPEIVASYQDAHERHDTQTAFSALAADAIGSTTAAVTAARSRSARGSPAHRGALDVHPGGPCIVENNVRVVYGM